MIPNDTASTIRSLAHFNSAANRNDQPTYDSYVTASFELTEIIHRAVQGSFLALRTPNCSGEPAQFLMPSTTEENMAHILRFDGCLRRWEDSLPKFLRHGSSDSLRDAATTRQAAVLHLR
jgi:hypothetical protein